MWGIISYGGCTTDLHVLCDVAKLCNIRDTGLCIIRQTDSGGQAAFWPNDSNGKKWMIETDISDINLRVVKVTDIQLESFASQTKRLSMHGGTIT